MRARSIIIMLVSFALLVTVMAMTALALEPHEAPKPPVKERELPPRTGFIPHNVDQSHITGQQMPEKFKDLMPPPAQLDWRTLGKVTSVRNQDTCGSCYAFAAIANIESKLLIDGAGTYDLSENNAKECPWYNMSCSGGNYWKLASWFSKKGVVLESCDPYVPWNTTCNSSCSYQKTLLDWRRICGASVPTTTLLKTYIQTYGPVYTVLYTGDSSDPTWRSTFGTYNGSTTLYYTGSYDPNHAVCIVGWDDTLTHGGGSGGWIVKNSWGTGWGGTCGYGTESGYFTIAYGSARIGEWSCYIQDWQTYDTNGDLLFYDEGGWTNSWGWGTGNPSAWGMCKFVPSAACSLKRVEFWTNDVTTDIDVYIYDTFSGGTLSNLLASQLNGSYAEVGYHSVALSSPPHVASGNDVYVAVSFTNSSYGWPVVADDVGPFETNKTYLSHYGSTWFEMGTNDSTDIAIRLRTTTGTMAPAISVSPDTLKYGQVPVSTDSILTLRVKNTGTDTLRVADINSSAPEFTLTDTLFSVAPSGSTNVSVTFRPTAVQIYSADLTILHNAKGSTVVPLTGEGVSAGAPGILVVPDSLKYGQVPVGVDSILTMRVKSTGTDTLHVTDIDPSDPTITLSDTAFVLAPSESTDVSVTFTPAAVQDYAESLTIFSDAVKAITVVSVTGEGIDNVVISVVPDSLKYGQVPVGVDSILTLRVKSTGTDTLHVTDIDPSDPTITLSDTAFVLAPSESTDVSVIFTPAAVQAYAESLTIFHNAKGFTIVPVSGAGAAGADLIITTGDIQFAPPAPMVGDTVTIEARVHNVTPPKWHFVAVESVLVRFYDGDPDTGGTQIGADQIILSIEPDSSEVAQVEWSTAGMVGYHPIHVLVDPDNQVLESNEGNNRASKAITVYSDPVVLSLILSDPSPTGPGEVDFTFTFDRKMDTDVAPAVSYGLVSPYYTNTITANPGWSADSTAWTGTDTIAAAKGDGLNFVRIEGAQDPHGHAMETDTSRTFFIDTVAPISQASSPQYSGSTSFTVSWSGADPAPASGLATYTVFVLVDGMYPTQWLSDITATSGIYSGSNGHFYSFYSLAIDSAGNEEPAPGSPDCTTYVDTDMPQISGTTVWPDTSFGGPFAVQSTIDDFSGIAMALLWYRTDLDTLWQADTMLVTKDLYQGVIPEQITHNTVVDYYVYAEDISVPANSRTDPPGAPGGGVYSFTAYVTSVAGESPYRGIPKKFALYQNYPDPFNAGTEILYALPRSCRARLEIFNVLGQRVILLVDEHRMAGYHTVRWDGRDASGRPVASGVYLYRLQAESYGNTRKMVLLR